MRPRCSPPLPSLLFGFRCVYSHRCRANFVFGSPEISPSRSSLLLPALGFRVRAAAAPPSAAEVHPCGRPRTPASLRSGFSRSLRRIPLLVSVSWSLGRLRSRAFFAAAQIIYCAFRWEPME
ncbi:unnamed protein product [Musa acuminata subsp. burmannicoides]